MSIKKKNNKPTLLTKISLTKTRGKNPGSKNNGYIGYVFLGILGVIFMYVGVAGVVSVSSPWWLGKGDAPRHIDYAWRVYNKQLPKFEDGLRQKDLNALRKNLYRNQPAASNPPLFYMIHAPFIGPSLKSGQWQKAIAIGRALNILIGVLCIAAFAWAGWLFGGRRRHIFAITVPALAALMHHFTILNLNYAVDVLLVLFSTLALINMYKIVQNGLRLKYIIFLTILSIGGMATKVTYLPFLLLSLASVVISPMLNSGSKNKKKIAKQVAWAFLISLGIVISVIFTIGWFYYLRNYKVTGNFTSNIPSDYPSTRPYKTAYMVLTGSGLWRLLYWNYSAIGTLSIALISASTMGFVAFLDRINLKGILRDKKKIVNIAILICSFVGMFLIQIKFSIGTGNYSFRYLIPALLPLALFLSYGLLEPRWTKGQLVTIFLLLIGGSTIYRASNLSVENPSLPSLTQISQSFKGLPDMVATNGISRSALIGLLFSFVFGAALISISLFNVLSPEIDKNAPFIKKV